HASPQGLLTPQKFLDRTALVFPDKTAIRFNEQSYSYAELSRRVNRLARALQKAELERGGRVGVLCSNIPAMLAAHFSVPLAGGVLVPVNVRLSAGEIAYILNHAGCKYLIADAEFANTVRPVLGNLAGLRKVIGVAEVRGGKPLGDVDYEEFLAGGNPKP